MSPHPRSPVIVGVGQLRANRDRTVEQAREPLALLVEALALAEADAGVPGLVAQADGVHAVKVASWAYDELAATVARAVGATPRTLVDTPLGGQLPVRLLDAAAAQVWRGDSEIAVVVGGEAQASVSLLGRAGIDPADRGWSREPGGLGAFDLGELGTPAMQAAELLAPTRVYPLYENRLQAELGLSLEESTRWSAQIYSDLSAVAARQPVAWNHEVLTPEQVGTVTPRNRIVCEPYPLAVNAMPHVDMAAAVIVLSHAKAVELGISDPVFVWGGAGADDDPDVLARKGFGASRSLELALDGCLAIAGGSLPELVDVYTCFPVVAKLVGLHLGLPRERVLSVTGGHSSFGGPLNTYALHALATMTQRLRAGGRGLVHANGGYLTYQHAVVLSADAHPDGYVGTPEPVQVRHPDAPAPGILSEALMVVETLTVEHDRDGDPARGYLVALDESGRRVAYTTPRDDRAAARSLSFAALPVGLRTHVGRRVRVHEGGVELLDP